MPREGIQSSEPDFAKMTEPELRNQRALMWHASKRPTKWGAAATQYFLAIESELAKRERERGE